mmetsp:Transcript_32505/g.67788  ORF Transcript_32505/g.67788 Transcript_32505/m.67788 type:complete len:260 (-) Transcript_32505:1449-2228(-)
MRLDFAFVVRRHLQSSLVQSFLFLFDHHLLFLLGFFFGGLIFCFLGGFSVICLVLLGFVGCIRLVFFLVFGFCGFLFFRIRAGIRRSIGIISFLVVHFDFLFNSVRFLHAGFCLDKRGDTRRRHFELQGDLWFAFQPFLGNFFCEIRNSANLEALQSQFLSLNMQLGLDVIQRTVNILVMCEGNGLFDSHLAVCLEQSGLLVPFLFIVVFLFFLFLLRLSEPSTRCTIFGITGWEIGQSDLLSKRSDISHADRSDTERS